MDSRLGITQEPPSNHLQLSFIISGMFSSKLYSQYQAWFNLGPPFHYSFHNRWNCVLLDKVVEHPPNSEELLHLRHFFILVFPRKFENYKSLFSLSTPLSSHFLNKNNFHFQNPKKKSTKKIITKDTLCFPSPTGTLSQDDT